MMEQEECQPKDKQKKATVIAHPNIALVKYWGKRNKELILPFTNSLSVTLDTFFTKTTVCFSEEYPEDIVILNSSTQKKTVQKIIQHVDLIWNYVFHKKRNLNVKIVSENNFPTSAGLASSSSGFAALTYAVLKALNIELFWTEISMLARQGSGSACRSVFGGFVEWIAGKDSLGIDSYAVKIQGENFWNDFKIIVVIVSDEQKLQSSRDAMETSVLTSPLFLSWKLQCQRDVQDIKKALDIKAFSMLGKIAEDNCLMMHKVMESSSPPITYRNKDTFAVMDFLNTLRNNGLECYFTIDAGPNVKLLTLQKNVEDIVLKLKTLHYVKNIVVCSVGKGVQAIKEDLF